MAKKVFIGVGHGGSDPGAIGNGFNEKDLNLSIALACNEVLKRHGVSVKMSREKDENDTLSEEIKECNAFKPDLAIDIHNNAGGGDGVEAFYHFGGGVSKTLAENVVAEIKAIGQNSRGVKIKKNASGTDYFGFIREVEAASVIVECAFVDNAEDVKIIDTEAERKVMGEAVAKGILKTLGIAYAEEKKPEAKPATSVSETVYTVVKGDSLSGIAAKHGTTWQKLAEYNNIANPHIIWVGQKIKIPGATKTVETPKGKIAVGSVVRVKNGAKTYDGKNLANFVYNRNHNVTELKGDRAVISYNGAIVAAVHKDNLNLV